VDNIQYSPEDEEYIRIIYSIAHEFPTSARCDFDDYVNVGLMALQTARETNTEPDKAKFTTYAHAVIRNAIMQEFLKNRNILKCSRYEYNNVAGAAEDTDFHNTKTISLDVKKDKGDDRVVWANNTYGAAHKASGRGRRKTLREIIVASGIDRPDEAAEKSEVMEVVSRIVDSLPRDDKDIIYRRVYEGDSLQKIAVEKNISWAAANQRFGQVMQRLKEEFEREGLGDYA